MGALWLAATARADDAYYEVRVDDLKLTEGVRPQPPSSDWRFWRLRERAWTMLPHVVLDGAGEGYINGGGVGGTIQPLGDAASDGRTRIGRHPH